MEDPQYNCILMTEDSLFTADVLQLYIIQCWLLDSSVRFFLVLGGNFVRPFSFSLQGGLGFFYEYAQGSFG
jgi:hypothetical protein